MTQPAKPAPVARRYPCLDNPRTLALLRSLRDDGPGTRTDLLGRLGPGNPEVLSGRFGVLRLAGLAEFAGQDVATRAGGFPTWTITGLGRSALDALDAHERREGGR